MEHLSPTINQESQNPPLIKGPELSKERRRLVGDTVRHLVTQFSQEYALASGSGNWREEAGRIAALAEENSRIIYERFPEEAHLLDSVNKMLGKLPSDCILPQIALSEHEGHYTPQERNQFRLQSAEWQADAITALFTLSKVKTDKESGASLLDSFYSVAKNAYRLASRESQRTDEYQGTMFSGLFGPVATAQVLHNNGYDVWLPKAKYDVGKRVDLLYGKHQENYLPEHIHFGQIKSARAETESISFNGTPTTLDTKDQEAWEIMNSFAIQQSESEYAKAGGIDFSSEWIRIAHTGLGDAESWQSTLEYLETELVLPESSHNPTAKEVA